MRCSILHLLEVNYPGEPLDFTVASYDIDYAMIGVSVMDKKVTTAELGEEHMRTLKRMAQEEGIITCSIQPPAGETQLLLTMKQFL